MQQLRVDLLKRGSVRTVFDSPFAIPCVSRRTFTSLLAKRDNLYGPPVAKLHPFQPCLPLARSALRVPLLATEATLSTRHVWSFLPSRIRVLWSDNRRMIYVGLVIAGLLYIMVVGSIDTVGFFSHLQFLGTAFPRCFNIL